MEIIAFKLEGAGGLEFEVKGKSDVGGKEGDAFAHVAGRKAIEAVHVKVGPYFFEFKFGIITS